MNVNLNKVGNRLIGLGGFVLGGLALTRMIYKVEPGERAIIFNKFGGQGVSKQVRGEGFHLYVPIVQEVIKYDVKIQSFDYFSFTGTKDVSCIEFFVPTTSRSALKLSVWSCILPESLPWTVYPYS